MSGEELHSLPSYSQYGEQRDTRPKLAAREEEPEREPAEAPEPPPSAPKPEPKPSRGSSSDAEDARHPIRPAFMVSFFVLFTTALVIHLVFAGGDDAPPTAEAAPPPVAKLATPKFEYDAPAKPAPLSSSKVSGAKSSKHSRNAIRERIDESVDGLPSEEGDQAVDKDVAAFVDELIEDEFLDWSEVVTGRLLETGDLNQMMNFLGYYDASLLRLHRRGKGWVSVRGPQSAFSSSTEYVTLRFVHVDGRWKLESFRLNR